MQTHHFKTFSMYATLVKLRSAVLVYLTHQMALPILKMVRKPELFPYSMEELMNFPPGSMGKDLATFIAQKKLKLLPYYARHDIKHILLQYDTTDDGEVCLQMFMMGNGHLSFPVLATVLYGSITMPEHWSKFKAAFSRGKNCRPIHGWEWFALLPQQTRYLQRQLSRNN
ncbi:MAG: hypothetical protein EOO03_13370 [Chitinophagaceae bacterium]|nr:MAG: hypothetical protein EOO03_13370 [Chitinophagaceae bacterium]